MNVKSDSIGSFFRWTVTEENVAPPANRLREAAKQLRIVVEQLDENHDVVSDLASYADEIDRKSEALTRTDEMMR